MRTGARAHGSRLAGGDRFELRDKLGEGGMGVVYRAYDRDRKIEVALKTLKETDARALYRFKREFRALADVAHPNLVTLYELHTVENEWFFTMELIEGVPFISYVRPYLAPVNPEQMLAQGGELVVDGAAPPETKTTGVWRRPPKGRDRIRQGTLDNERLGRALIQLVDGVSMLHGAGKLHRDLKPPNVLVTPSGRVVLLDFGLALDTVRGHEDQTHDSAAVGTPMYMSPEQAADVPLDEASDWYSVGVMLYEALTGFRPFEADKPRVHLEKQLQDPPRPAERLADVPPRLDELCMQLLHRDPRERAGAEEVLAAFDRGPATANIQLRAPAAKLPFVGRQEELGLLRAALEDSRDHCVGVFVRGYSGMGKSRLVRRFLEEVETSTDAVVLNGRCYERESVPFKALDATIDALTRYLLAVPGDEIERLMPREIVALARIFPVLRRVPAIAAPTSRSFLPGDPHELRRRAFGALRYLLLRISEGRPVVLYVDDIQWGGADSAAFLAELLVHPSAPKLLLLLSYRLEDEDQAPIVTALHGSEMQEADTRDLTVSALPEAEALALTRELGADIDEVQLRPLLEESGGSPMFLVEVARAAAAPDSEVGGMSLDALLRRRINALGEDQRSLLEVCSVAARPMRPDSVSDVADLSSEGASLAMLRAERLLRSTLADNGQILVQPYHDRVRQAVVAEMTSERRRQLHRALARTLERQDASEADALVEHWLAAGEPAKAGRYAAVAAQAASETLAFHRAAEFYALALEHGELTDEQSLRTQYGHVLAHSGRLDEAAVAFARAAQYASGDDRLELGRLELEQLLRQGNLEKGMVKAREVLGAVGLRLPRSARGAIISIAAQRALLRMRGFEGAPRDTEITPEQSRRLDVCWSASSAISFVNPLLGRALQLKYMRLALSSGTLRHIAYALSLELGYRGMAGASQQDAVEELCRRGTIAAREVGDARIIGQMEASAGFATYLGGRFALGLERMVRGYDMLRKTGNARWEIDITQIMELAARLYLGQMGEVIRRLPMYVREAAERGDVYARRGLEGWRSNIIWLALDRPDEAIERAEDDDVESPRGFHLHHYYGVFARTQAALYSGHGQEAWEHLLEVRHLIRRSLLMRIQSVRIETRHMYARAALASLTDSSPSERHSKLAAARKTVKQMTGDDAQWSHALAKLARAGIERATGDEEQAVETLRQAASDLDAVDMALHAVCARRGLGLLLGGDEGKALVSAADTWMRGESIVDPATFARLYAPGFD